MARHGDRFTGRVLHDTFVVDERIGEGGMGVVYTAHNAKTPGIRYAVKVLRTDGVAEPADVLRFRREAQALAALDHPSIVRPVHADVTPEGEPYLVMELVRGVSLRARLAAAHAADAPLPFMFVLAVLDGVADALDHAHGRGIVHRDLKPENVLVVEAGRSILVKVLDFGIAKIFHPDGRPADTVTTSSQVAGTVSYMAPEQCRDLRQATAASDRFALGVMAFEMLTGRRPFDSNNAAGTICNILLEPLLRASALRPDVPGGVDAVLARACAKEPAARYDGAGDFVLALAAALGHELTSGPVALNSRPPGLAGLRDAGEGLASLPTVPSLEPAARPAADARDAAADRPAVAVTAPPTAPDPRPARAAPARLSPAAVVALVGATAALTSGAVLLLRPRPHRDDGRGPTTQALAEPAERGCPGAPRPPTPGLYDDEVCIPGGAFVMGSPAGEGDHDEHPRRVVTLAPFYADRYEVTVARYRRCVAGGGCDPRGLDLEGPFDASGRYAARGTRFRPAEECTWRPEPSTHDTLPINCLSYAQADQVCRFEGRRMLSEAEWERLARGPGPRPRTYPWGEAPPDCTRAAFGYGAGCGLPRPVPVGSARAGVTAEGIYDLAGNVSEWTHDWYSAVYYARAPALDPPGATPDATRAESGDAVICQDGCRATRGANWRTPFAMVSVLRGAQRFMDAPNRRSSALGVRCGRSP